MNPAKIATHVVNRFYDDAPLNHFAKAACPSEDRQNALKPALVALRVFATNTTRVPSFSRRCSESFQNAINTAAKHIV